MLVVDDEQSIRESLRMVLEYAGYEVSEAASGRDALRRVSDFKPEAVVLDIKMPEMDGLATLVALRERGHDVPVLMITGHGDVATAVEATRLGAYDFFEKPLEKDRVLLSLRNATDAYRLQRENRSLKFGTEDLVGSSQVMKTLRETAAKAAPTPATVLITGESGTGKELVAREIYLQSTRKDRPFVQVNCAAIPDELIESELFGHEKGSFTGAVKKQVGKFVAAHGGTIFLDEIGDMSARTQAKVLRVLQSGEVEPVGTQKPVVVDVRVIAATNRDLEAAIEEGKFREDLFYRLNVIPIQTPPLREHLSDIPELVEHFVARYVELNQYAAKEWTRDAIDYLKTLPWKGNVRELKNMVERLLILSSGSRIDKIDVLGLTKAGGGDGAAALFAAETLREFRELSERQFLLHKLRENGWNVTQTARAIDTPRSNVYKKMEQYGIEREENAAAEKGADSG